MLAPDAGQAKTQSASAAGDATLNRYVGNQPTGHVDSDGLEAQPAGSGGVGGSGWNPWNWPGIWHITVYPWTIGIDQRSAEIERNIRRQQQERALANPQCADPEALRPYASGAEIGLMTNYAEAGIHLNVTLGGAQIGSGVSGVGGSRPSVGGGGGKPPSGGNGGFSGHSGFELRPHPNQPIRNPATVVNGRNYSGHALDQMQNRGVPPSVVDNCIRTGKPFAGNTAGTQGYYDAVNGVRVIIISENGTVIAVIR